MKRNYDVCVFDLDGTLIDSLGDLAESCNNALSLFDLPTHSPEKYRYFVGNGIRNLIGNSMGEKAEDEKLFRSVYVTFNMIYEEKCLEKTRPYKGITNMLEALKNNGVKIGILSNKADDFAKRIAGALFDSSLIDIVYGQKKEYPTKPAPDSLFALLEELDTKREKCLYLGDSDVDVITAKNADVDFCGAQWGFRGYDELKSAGAQIIAAAPSDITKLVLE